MIAYPAWFEFALCAETDPEAFYPPSGDTGRRAKAVCAACPVRAKCLGYALGGAPDHEGRDPFDHGVWGGLNAEERKRVKRAMRGAA